MAHLGIHFSMRNTYMRSDFHFKGSMGLNNVYDENFFICCMWVPYHIIYSISAKKWYVTMQIKKI